MFSLCLKKWRGKKGKVQRPYLDALFFEKFYWIRKFSLASHRLRFCKYPTYGSKVIWQCHMNYCTLLHMMRWKEWGGNQKDLKGS